MTDHNRQGTGIECLRRFQNMLDEWFASKLVQNLSGLRVHSSPFAGSKHHNVCLHFNFLVAVRLSICERQKKGLLLAPLYRRRLLSH